MDTRPAGVDGSGHIGLRIINQQRFGWVEVKLTGDLFECPHLGFAVAQSVAVDQLAERLGEEVLLGSQDLLLEM